MPALLSSQVNLRIIINCALQNISLLIVVINMSEISKATIFSALLLMQWACAAVLEPNSEDAIAQGSSNALCQRDADFNNQEEGSITKTCVKATNASNWVYYKLSSKSAVAITSPTTSTDWDLAFQRFRIKLNGGVSGPGRASLLTVSGVSSFDSANKANSGDYLNDQNFSTSYTSTSACYTAGGINYAFLNDFTSATGSANNCWFTYSVSTHKLSPKDQYYFFTDAGGSYYKLKITNYYSESGSSGYISFDWAKVLSP